MLFQLVILPLRFDLDADMVSEPSAKCALLSSRLSEVGDVGWSENLIASMVLRWNCVLLMRLTTSAMCRSVFSNRREYVTA